MEETREEGKVGLSGGKGRRKGGQGRRKGRRGSASFRGKEHGEETRVGEAGVGKEGWVNSMGAGGGASVLTTKGGAEGLRTTGTVAGIKVSTSLVQLQMVELAVTSFEANTLSRSIFCSFSSHLARSSATALCWCSLASNMFLFLLKFDHFLLQLMLMLLLSLFRLIS